MKKIKICKTTLVTEYSKKEQSIAQVAKILGCSVATIYDNLKNYNIKIRNKSEANRKGSKILTKLFLIKEYIKKEKNTYIIAEETKLAPNTIRRYLKEYGIKIRNYSESQTGKGNNNYIDGRTNKKYYCKQKGCNNEISLAAWKYANGNCIDCGNKIMAKKAKGRKRPDLVEINRKRIGDKNANFIDGRSYEPYPIEFNKGLKEEIRKRDNYICQLCGMTEEEHIIVYGQVLHIHHIDYNKKNCKKENLTTLCKQCNVRANYNRDYWTEYFNQKVKLC